MRLARRLRSLLNTQPAPRRQLARRLALESLEERENPSTGGLLDPTFGSGGHVLGSFAGTSDRAFAVATQAEGKIVVAGDAASTRTQSDFLVAQYNADGTLDTTFGSGGYTATDFNRLNDIVFAVAVQADGKIVAGGTVASGGRTTTSDFGLVRYNATGALDTTFGNKGKVITNLGAASEQINSVLVDGSGRILVGGYTTNAAGQNVAALARYNANGTLDSTFGSGGKLVTSIRVTIGYTSDQIVLQPDGKIVLAGVAPDTATNLQRFVVARFNANGTADTGFGSGGVVATQVGQFNDAYGAVTIDGSGRILVAGYGSHIGVPSTDYLLRYNTDGTLDGTFGSDGVAILTRTEQWFDTTAQSWKPVWVGGWVAGVAVQADGEVVVGGQMYNQVDQLEHFVAARVNAAGGQDAGYGAGGWADAQFATQDEVHGMILQADGRLLLAGAVTDPAGRPQDVALVRFLPSAPQVGLLSAVQNTDGTTTLTASGVTDGNSGETVTQVEFFYFDSAGARQSLGFGTQDADGSWSLTLSLPPGSYTLYAQATDSYGALGDPHALSLTVA
jgi:uncharacterized delta-60 repeat protein